MKSLIDVFRMEEVSKEVRAQLIIDLGFAINHQYGANLTEPLVYELVKILEPEHKIISASHYLQYVTKRS